jgi:hypothetical protein
VKEACDPTVSANLLEHRYGLLNSSEGALYRVTKSEEIRGLESQIFDFFSGGSSAPEEFGLRFNVFADYLRENHLGCKWPFLAYLAFLLRVQTYFPVLPSRFDALLQFYGIEESISGHVSWERYSILLELAEVLKSKLGMYGQPSAIEIQSYMWVVSYLIKGKKVRRNSTKKPDFNSELEARVQRARQRERIGWAGEWFVYNHEISKLKDVERADLANRVQLVSSDGEDVGFDILSFNPDGSKLHIEVKTTTRSPVDDNGFWLSETEKRRAERDDCWTLYRVWNIDLSPSYENLGNIVSQKNENWELTISNWYVRARTNTIENSRKPIPPI